jgi:hypothetical protein
MSATQFITQPALCMKTSIFNLDDAFTSFVVPNSMTTNARPTITASFIILSPIVLFWTIHIQWLHGYRSLGCGCVDYTAEMNSSLITISPVNCL